MIVKPEDIEKLKGQLESQSKRIDDLESFIRQTRISPVMVSSQDAGTIESIYDILLDSKLVTVEDIKKYMDKYRHHISTIIHILIDEGLTTERGYNCKLMAFHHMIRILGLNTGMSQEKVQEERIKYAKWLEAQKDPLEFLGR